MNAQRQNAAERGVGLIEILVALLVLSMGFLYTANMQVRAMRANQAAYYHSQALMLAGDMMDRMRGNPAGVAAGGYDNRTTATAVAEPTCHASGCSATDLASADLYDWRAKLVDVRNDAGFAPLLPPAADGTPASGEIELQAGGDYLITLTWQEFDDGTTSPRTVELRFVP